MKSKTLVIPRVSHPIWWMIISFLAVSAIGTWGLLYPEARASQITLNIFVNDHGNKILDLLAQGVEKFFSPVYAIGLTAVLAILVWIFKRSWCCFVRGFVYRQCLLQ